MRRSNCLTVSRCQSSSDDAEEEKDSDDDDVMTARTCAPPPPPPRDNNTPDRFVLLLVTATTPHFSSTPVVRKRFSIATLECLDDDAVAVKRGERPRAARGALIVYNSRTCARARKSERASEREKCGGFISLLLLLLCPLSFSRG